MKAHISRRSRQRSLLRGKRFFLETLEPRLQLDASNIFATFSGELTPTETSDSQRVYLTPSNFTLGAGQVTLGFLVKPAEGSSFRANAIDVRSVTRGAVPAIKKTEFPDGSSLVLASVKHGEHVLQITGKNGARGAWQMQVILVGDVNCDFVVNNVDYALVSDVVSGKTKDPAFFAEADADRDGKITSFDLARVHENRGSSTSLRSLAVTTGLAPASDTGVLGDNRVNTVQVNVAGSTSPGVQVSLDQDGDGFDDGMVTVGTSRTYGLKATLVEGQNALAVQAKDSFGQVAVGRTSVFRDTQLSAPNFDLSLGSDTGVLGDNVSAAGKVTLVGRTDPGETVTLKVGGATIASALATGAGAFQFVGVGLELGGNDFTARVEDAAGNVRQVTRTLTRVAPAPGQKDPVLRWNEVALDAIRRDASSPPVASRALAMVGVAILDAVSALEGTPSYLVRLTPPAGASTEAAAAAAAHAVLSYLYPGQQSAFDSTLTAALAQVPAGSSKSDGVTFGRAVGNAVIALRANDGAREFEDYFPDGGSGAWQPTTPMFAEALLPNWATVEPFAIASPDQFRPKAPPALAGVEYAAAVNEVQEKGRATGSTRTADETQLALFWADGLGTVTPPGHWNQVAMQLATAEAYSLSASARLFAQLNVALADAAIASWDAKYHYGLWRPVTAIREADTDNNDATVPDGTWTPLLVTPSFPSYTSGHSAFSGAAQVVLESFFGRATPFTLSTEAPGVSPRSYGSFKQAAEEAGQSRILGGIHYSFDNQAGLNAGRGIADVVLEAFALNADKRAPSVSIQSPDADFVTAANPTVRGQALDNLSGVSTLEVQIDTNAYAPVAVNSAGMFEVPTALAVDGTADGTHTLRFRATDFAGNVSSAQMYSFTLDTLAPTISLTSPQEDDSLTASSRISGIASGTGSAVTALSYSFDGGAATTVVFDPATGAFNQALDLSTLAVGPHTLLVTAVDAAGHTTTSTVVVNLAAAIPLTITEVSPVAGASEAGSTEKPRVLFSRPIDKSTLNGDNFYATDTTGSKLPAHIVFADDATRAWLFFSSSMPGGSTITVTVDGATIMADDGTLLDAAGSGTPGSKLTYSFTTVSLASLPGTSLTGILADPGADLRPNTIDDVRRGPDGVLMTGDDVYLNPIANVRVYILGQEPQAVFTDAQGRFTLPSVPSGNVKFVLDGMTATNTPAGSYFPEMVMDLTIEPGKVNTVMGSMGSRDQMAASEEIQGVYLPRLKSTILHDVSDFEPTLIDVPAEAAPDLTAEQRALLSAVIQPGTAVGAFGQVMTNVQLGISTVPTELIREMLPPGVSEPPFTITVQAPGVVTFTTPVAVSYPNVDNAAPGTKMLFISFNHATGRLELDGTATVSADGQSVVTDPDSGITHPGWHFVINGSPAQIQVGGSASNACASGDDFKSADFPTFTPTLFEQSLLFFRRMLSDADLVSEFRTYMKLLTTGSLGQDMVTQFIGGSGAKYTHGVGGELSQIAKGTAVVKGIVDDIKMRIQRDIQLQANGGMISGPNLSSYVVPRPNFTISDAGLKMKSIIGGTQGTDAFVDNFQATGTIIDPSVGGFGSYTGSVRLVICDDFGVDRSDIYAPPLAAFWILQHERFGNAPFVNEIIVEFDLSGNFTIPPGYEDVIINSPALLGQSASLGTTLVSATPAGFGDDPTIYFRYLLDGGPDVVGTLQPDGGLPSIVLPAGRFFTASFYQPSTNRGNVIASVSGASGEVTLIGSSPLSEGNGGSRLDLPIFGGVDSDGDGIPDFGESTIGTDPTKTDSDGDGIPDATELEQGLDPLDGRSFPTGVIATLPLQGSPERVAVDGDRVYAATGAYGLAVIDGTRFDGPIVLGQLDLPGTATDVGVDANLNIAAIATGSNLQLVDVTDGMQPRLLRSVNVAATRVQVANGLAYAASGTQLRVVDLASGILVQSLTLPGSGTLTGFAREGNFLYAFVSGSDTFSVIDIGNEGGAVVRGQRVVSIASSDVGLFVGNGVAWLSGSGLRTIDVSNPASPQIIATPTGSQFFTARRIALNGSGLGLLLPDGGNFLQVYDTSNPSNIANLLLQFNLTGNARDVVISRGVAYVATTAGLEVVNYRPFDNAGAAPTVTVSTSAVDQNPAAPGLQVLEGTTLPIRVNVSDDVQVRNVELLVNGAVVGNDVSFPFDFFAAAPSIASVGSAFDIQVRAFDTGGNASLSNALSFELVKDTFAPTITGFVPPTNASVVEPIQVVQVRFSEPMAGATIRSDTVRVFDEDNNVVTPATFQLRDNDRLVQLTFPALGVGKYRIEVSGAVTDRAGNALGTSKVFEQSPVSNAFGGFFSNPLNSGASFAAAENFTLSGMKSITSVAWIGAAIARGGNLGTTADYRNPSEDFSGFSINFYGSTGGANSRPDQLLFSESFAIEDTNQTASGLRYFQHNVSLTSPFLAQAGVEYWVSVQALARDPSSESSDNYLWGFGASGDQRERSDDLRTSTPWDFQNASNLGFSLSSDRVVSPFTLTPRATLATTVTDAAPGTPGLQVYEGTTVPFTATVVAGVNVQQVELIVDGASVASDTTAPYQFSYIAPNIAPDRNGFGVLAKVTDTAGLITFTTPSIEFGLLEDTTPPAVVVTSPPHGGKSFKGLTTIQVTFSEGMAAETFSPANFAMVEAGPGGLFDDGNDVPLDISAVSATVDDSVAVLSVAALQPGVHRLTVIGTGITDRAGNSGAGTFTSQFTVDERPGLDGLLDLRGTPVAGNLFLSSDKMTLAVNSGGSLIVGGTGLVFDGREFVIYGSPVWNQSLTYNGGTYANGSGMTAITRENLSMGDFHGFRLAGNAGTNLKFERVIGFFDGDEFAVIATRLTNLTGAPLNNVATMENTDPDQGIPLSAGYNTNNDVVLGGDLVRAHVTTGLYPGGLTMGFGSADPRAVASAEGFSNTSPYDIINSPADPNGASDDIGINLALNFGTVPAFGTAVGGLVLVLGKSVTQAEQTYQQAAPITLDGARLRAAQVGHAEVVTPLQLDAVRPLADAATKAWADVLGIVPPIDVTLAVTDLPDNELGLAGVDGLVTLDIDAGGVGWFVDATPLDNSEFVAALAPCNWEADAGSPAAGRYDLFTVLLHEIGHVLGIEHSSDPDDLMAETLAPGERRTPNPSRFGIMPGYLSDSPAGPQVAREESVPAVGPIDEIMARHGSRTDVTEGQPSWPRDSHATNRASGPSETTRNSVISSEESSRSNLEPRKPLATAVGDLKRPPSDPTHLSVDAVDACFADLAFPPAR